MMCSAELGGWSARDTLINGISGGLRLLDLGRPILGDAYRCKRVRFVGER
jgi:hypothetical protein